MKEISSKRLKELETEVKKEFPENYGLQQIHLARLIIEEKTKDMSPDQLIEYYRGHAGIVKKRVCVEQKSLKKDK